MFVAGIFQRRHCQLEKFGVAVYVLAKFAARVSQKELRVFLVRETVGGDMIRLKSYSFLQGQFPLLDGLAW